ncbi:adenosylcobinamide-GDP ribazoletransferase [Corynebacterium sp. H128]|uniref:adenosylcobinamide-GDP ribazoletransferase n=1 Tax=unclassified Corynebacterium TaxID=2624378 RepID=UPI0030A3710F
MSGKAGHSGDGNHGNALVEGIGTALSWLTIFPARGAQTFDRTTGARAMAAIPVAGLALGSAVAVPTAIALSFSAPALLIAALTIVGWELGSRMMHIDGLADVGDALGSYAPPERAQEILGDRYTGALGMGAVLLTLLTQLAGLSAIFSIYGTRGALLSAIVPAIGRAASLIGCHCAYQPFSSTGFGSLIIGTVRTGWIAGWLFGLATLGTLAMWLISRHILLGPTLAVLTAALGAHILLRHCNRRFQGLNGDCIGAAIEVAVAIAVVTLALTF